MTQGVVRETGPLELEASQVAVDDLAHAAAVETLAAGAIADGSHSDGSH